MSTMTVKSRIGPTGVVTVTVPASVIPSETEVLVTIRPAEDAVQRRARWQKVVDQTYGACQALDLEEPPDEPWPEEGDPA